MGNKVEYIKYCTEFQGKRARNSGELGGNWENFGELAKLWGNFGGLAKNYGNFGELDKNCEKSEKNIPR